MGSTPLSTLIESRGKPVPLLLHLPHSGTFIPGSIRSRMLPEMAESQDETDWYLDRLYQFALDLGIDIYMANYSRWVVDLNRNPEGTPLYDDGRVITDVIPFTDFNGKPLYHTVPGQQDRKKRLDSYFYPYFRDLQSYLDHMLDQFGRVLLWDGHSIRRHVEGISKQPFPDMTLGTDDGQSAPRHLIDQVLKELRSSDHQVTHNDPFKGGYITRSLHKSNRKIYTVQLEMSKDLYMDDDERTYSPQKAKRVEELLRQTIKSIIKII